MISHLGADDPGGGRLRLRLPAVGQRPRRHQLHRRRLHLHRRLPRGAQYGRRLEAAAHPGHREQPLRLFDAGPPAVCRRAAERPRASATASPARRWTATIPTPWPRSSPAPSPAPAPATGPTLIEAMLGRMRGHAEGDDSLKVVPPDELAAYRAADPVPAYARRLEEDGVLDAATRQRLEARIAELVESAISGALDAAPPDRLSLSRPVFAPSEVAKAGRTGHRRVPWVHQGQPAKRSPTSTPSTRVFWKRWSSDESVIYMGQDIGVFEGAFRSTKGLARALAARGCSTPPSPRAARSASPSAPRSSATGRSSRCSSATSSPAASTRSSTWRRSSTTAGRCPVRIVVRLPTGGGVGAGPFHSQNPEGWFAHTAGIKVVCPADRGRRQWRC